jgi:transcriptional regulator with XRE-family HTH domain
MDKESRDRLANKVKILRGDHTHSEFAKILGISGGSISYWENSKNVPTIENLEKLAELANQLPEEFLADVYGRKISTNECPSLTFTITAMGNKEIGDVLMLIGQKIAGGHK